MENIHGVLEWIPLAFFAVIGFPLDRWVPARRPRYIAYAALIIAAFVMDLNKATFKSDAMDAVFWTLLLAGISELFWVCVRKKSRLLLCGASVMLIPAFIYIYFAWLMLIPMPCHEDRRETVGEFECAAGRYILKKRLSFDIFRPAQVYVLIRRAKHLPFEMQVDKVPSPKGYMEADFKPFWYCLEGEYRGGVKVDLFHEYEDRTIWTLIEEPKND